MQLTFFDALYFVIITITTVGFGDISPLLITSKLLVIVLIICLLIILPRETDKIGKIVEKTSEYDQRFQALEGGDHVVICGKPTALGLQRFLSELVAGDAGVEVVKKHTGQQLELKEFWRAMEKITYEADPTKRDEARNVFDIARSGLSCMDYNALGRCVGNIFNHPSSR